MPLPRLAMQRLSTKRQTAPSLERPPSTACHCSHSSILPPSLLSNLPLTHPPHPTPTHRRPEPGPAGAHPARAGAGRPPAAPQGLCPPLCRPRPAQASRDGQEAGRRQRAGGHAVPRPAVLRCTALSHRGRMAGAGGPASISWKGMQGCVSVCVHFMCTVRTSRTSGSLPARPCSCSAPSRASQPVAHVSRLAAPHARSRRTRRA